MATPFSTAITDAATEVTGYITTALPLVLGVAAAFLGIKYGRRLIRGL
jgi:hypothetical protein